MTVALWPKVAKAIPPAQQDAPEIERTAAQDGPSQVIAELHAAAAGGVTSRWPL